MQVNQDVLVDNLYKILTSSIANTRFFNARSKGFRAELDYTKKVESENGKFLDAGQFVVSRKEESESPENYIFYMTVTADSKDRYNDFYKIISQLPEIKELFFIEIEDASKWDTKKILVKDDQNRNRIEVNILKKRNRQKNSGRTKLKTI